jgi:hypothetical protein
MKLTASQFQELLAKAPDKVLFLKNAELAQPTVLPELSVKEALYHHQRGRVFRQTKQEQASGRLTCPHCTSELQKVRLRANEHGYTCPRCRWSIHRDDIFDPAQKAIPDVRDPGDATGPDGIAQDDGHAQDVVDPVSYEQTRPRKRSYNSRLSTLVLYV